MQNLLEDLTKLLASEARYAAEGRLLKNKIVEDALKLNPGLLHLLLKSKPIKRHFFEDIEGVLVFDKVKFQAFVSNKEFLPDSYTAFKNKIGLVDENGRYIYAKGEVTLVWPYKDCILEGGQTKEDQKRDEIFWNETLAPDEIDRLLSPKVITNWKKFDTKDEYVFTGDEKIDFDRENYIIKGNNLLALHSICKRFGGKVKLIYIDPPYNTGNDSFRYNDSFDHSTWMTFMKSRLQIAKNMLSDDGFIFVQCDDNEQEYLKVLMVEIFGRENFRNSIFWHRTYAGKTVSKNLPWNTDIIHVFSKSPNSNIFNVTSDLSSDDISSYNKDDNDGRGKYNTVSLQKTGGPGPETTYDYVDNNGKVWKCPKKGWRMRQSKLKQLENDNRLYITETTIREKYYLSERLEIGKQIDNFWGDIGNLNRSNDISFGLTGQKPEVLIQRIMEMTTKEGGLVLDFFAGSGTTGAVAHKMGRRYILIEQLDYIHELPEARLKKVIAGEQGGISKSVNWKGGGSFIYCELLEWNEAWMTKIQKAASAKELKAIWKELSKSPYINYRLIPQNVDDNIADFDKLSLGGQKKFLMEILNKNQLYVNYSEIDDKDFKVSQADKLLNKGFYNG